MSYQIAQMPEKPELYDVNQPKTTVQPIETQMNRGNETNETALIFPLSFPKLADALNAKGLKCNANTLKGRWKNKYILPAIDGVDMPDVLTANGVTEFGFQIIGEIITRCVHGDKGMTIAPEKLRDEMIERYGMKPVKDSLQTTKDLLERSQQIKKQSDDRAESTALARVEAKSELEILQEAIKTLNSAQSDDDDTYELSPEEKAKLAKKFLAKKVAEQEYLQRLAKGEV